MKPAAASSRRITAPRRPTASAASAVVAAKTSLSLVSAVALALVFALASCSSGEPAVTANPTVEPNTEAESEVAAPDASAVAIDVDYDPGSPPARFCVDPLAVDTTLSLRTGPTADSAIIASVDRFSCSLTATDTAVVGNFQPVTFATYAGLTDGWVNQDFITPQDPLSEIHAAALTFVSAWQRNLDPAGYSYGAFALPEPVSQGQPALVKGPNGFGCVLLGDITIDCAIAVVDRDGTELARLSVGVLQRGTNGNDGEPYFAEDFPDGPTVVSFEQLS